MIRMFKNLYSYRQLLKSNIRKEIRGKYKGSFLGVLWSFVSPLLMTLVYAIVFPHLLKNAQDHYITFIVIAILPWTWFTNVISQGTPSILTNGGIVKKVFFPREILPISIVSSGLINYLISVIIIFIFLFFSGIGYSLYIVFFPLVLITQYVLLLGVSLILSSINVYIRDTEYIVIFFVQMLFYGTPILYSSQTFGDGFLSTLVKLNPLTTIIEGYRSIFFYQQAPDFLSLGLVFLFSVVLLKIGTMIFYKLEKGFAEEL
jgi:ABC-2 type transport system permease protein